MRTLLIFFITTMFVMPSFAANNPDAGKLFRMVCYAPRVMGDLSTKDPNFAIVVQLRNTDDVDASYFLPGNSNYKTGLSPVAEFDVSIYKNASTISVENDVVAFSNALVEAEPTRHILAEGAADGGVIGVSWNNDHGSIIYFPGASQNASLYTDGEIKEARSLYCLPPFSVDEPNNAPAVEQGNQEAQAGSEVNGVATSL